MGVSAVQCSAVQCSAVQCSAVQSVAEDAPSEDAPYRRWSLLVDVSHTHALSPHQPTHPSW